MKNIACLPLAIFTLFFSIESHSRQHGVADDMHSVSFDSLYSSKELGCIVKKTQTTFRLFAPRATNVELVLFEKHDSERETSYAMKRDTDGVWEYTIKKSLIGKYYGYRVSGPKGKGEMFHPDILIGDPYAKAVVTKNNYHQQTKTLIIKTEYDWEGDTFVVPADHNKLVIYESHIRDLTVHPSSGITKKGTYLGLTEKNKTGGLAYLKDLGVNAIELLPAQKFGAIELPFKDSSVNNFGYPTNTWNPYERNHWGYMTDYFFAPENYYGTDGTMKREAYNGADGRAVREFKDMVKSFHREGIAVLMDVVFNHVAHYSFNPFKYIDKLYYFQCDTAGNFKQASGCGNDFKTNRPMARRVIVDCIKYWMTEYHVDGFRFDLATMIDWETCKQITAEARKINPNVILIAEPWGGGKYDLAGFSDIGWAAWNDLIRNGVKGQNPNDGLEFIFGKFQGNNTKKSIMSYATGTLREDGGPFLRKEHSINYLESHDDNTMGDFIRIGTREVSENQKITDVNKNVKLSPKQLALNKLAALFLFTSQGPIMMHEGQEYARSKVIAPTDAPDPRVGMIDHNSYDKDNETNYLNYSHRDLNRKLYDYYKGLIELRKKYPLLSSAPKSAVEFFETDDDFLIAYRVTGKRTASTIPPRSRRKESDIIVILNGNSTQNGTITLPDGGWRIMVNAERVEPDSSLGVVGGKVSVPPTSGMVLVKQ